MRKFAAIALAGLSIGCAGSVAYVIPSQPGNVASLRFEKPSDDAAFPFAKGIYRIDAAAYLGPPYADHVFLAPGRHRIGINCTKFIHTDEQPSLRHTFAAGVAYVLTCQEDGPRIEPDPAG